MAEVKEDLFYTKEHEWVKIDGKTAKTGITDYAQHKLGDITFVELPDEGKSVKQFEALTGLESVKAASDIYAVLSGKILSVNKELENAPEKINQSPYGEGWIAEIEISDESEKGNLMDAGAYKEYIGGLE